jgi:DNA repair protein RecO (recombination protein O)
MGCQRPRLIPITARNADHYAASGLWLRSEQLGQSSGTIGGKQLVETANRLAVDHNLWKGAHAGDVDQLVATVRIACEIYLLVRDPPLLQERLGAATVGTHIGGIDDDWFHHFRKDSLAGSLKTEALVLRSIRYGEADRILHLYTPDHGRVGAIAKGARRAKSRFGARLEPFMQVNLVLHLGRGDLHTVTGADTVEARPGLRDSADSLDAAARACDAVARLFETDAPHPEVYALLANELTLLASRPATASLQNAVAFRLKLLLAAGIVPQLGSCANCGEREHLTGFSAAAGGVVCSSCESAAFPLGEEAYQFLVSAIGQPLANAPHASARALQLAERAIRETAEHHAQVRLRPLPRAA